MCKAISGIILLEQLKEINMYKSDTAQTALLGKVFGRLTVTKFIEMTPKTSIWEAHCECGNITQVRRGNLVSGATKSCGCLCVELSKEREAIHGHSRGGVKSPTYKTWESIKTRCNPNNNTNNEHYADKGITVCDRWLESFENFLEDMGDKPSKDMSIDRIDNEKGYSKENCRWSTIEQQARNKSYSKIWKYCDITAESYRQLASIINVDESIVYYRCTKNKDGFSVESKYKKGQ